MDVHPPKNGIFIGIDPYPYKSKQSIIMMGIYPLVMTIIAYGSHDP